MVSRSECGAFVDHTLSDRSFKEREVCTLEQDRLELVGIIGREDELLLTEAALDARIERVHECQVVADPDEAHLALLELGVDPRQVVDYFISCAFYEMVDLVEDEDDELPLSVDRIEERLIDFIRREPGRGDDLVEEPCELGDEPVFGVRRFLEFAVEIEYSYGNSFVGRDTLELFRHSTHRHSLSRPCLTVDEEIARAFMAHARSEDLTDVLNLLFPVRYLQREIMALEDAFVLEE